MFETCIVTGAAGFIGSHLCDSLVGMGKIVTGIDNLEAGSMRNLDGLSNSPNFRFIKADITQYNQIEKYFDVDAVFHNACSKCAVCRVRPYHDLQVNAIGTWNVLEASRRMGVKKVVHASTGSTMDGTPRSFYGVSKAASEMYFGAFEEYYGGFNYSILRYYHVYGTKQRHDKNGGVIPIFIRTIHEGRPITIHGDGKQVRHFTHVDDIVDANLLMMELSHRTRGIIYDCVSDVRISIIDLGILLHRLMGKDITNIKFEPRRPGDIEFFKIDNEPLKKLGMVFGNDLESDLGPIIDYYTNL